MNTPSLSPAAQLELDRLERPTIVGDWISNYHAMLRKLVERDTSNMADWEIRGRGIKALEKSREKYRVAAELKTYAIPLLESLHLLELDGSPESPTVSLDEFLKQTMPNTGRDVLRERFMQYLTERARNEVDIQMSLHPRPAMSRDEHVKQMAEASFALYDDDGMAGPSRNIYGPCFRAWWKTQADGNNLSEPIKRRRMEKSVKIEKMKNILPKSNRPNEGWTSAEWEKRADIVLEVRGGSFRRYQKALLASGAVVEKNGKFRVPRKSLEKKRK